MSNQDQIIIITITPGQCETDADGERALERDPAGPLRAAPAQVAPPLPARPDPLCGRGEAHQPSRRGDERPRGLPRPTQIHQPGYAVPSVPSK